MSFKLLVVFCVVIGIPTSEAGIPFLSWLIDWEVVCDPDFQQCPHGGLSFRDRKHNCEFTPCDLIPAPPSRPPPPDPKTLPMIHWFGVEEFVVPALDVTAMIRGKALASRWIDSIRAKLGRLSPASPVVLDVYLVPRSPQKLPYETYALQQHMNSILASEPNLPPFKSQGTHTPSLTVAHLPWSRWQFFGQFALQPTSINHLQATLLLLQQHIKANNNSTMAGFASLVFEEQSDDIEMDDILVQCDRLVEKKSLTEYVSHEPHITTAHPRNASTNVAALVLITRVALFVDEQRSDTSTELSLSLVVCPNISLDSNTSRPTVGVSREPSPSTQLLVHPSDITHSRPIDWRCSCWRLMTHSSVWVLCRQ